VPAFCLGSVHIDFFKGCVGFWLRLKKIRHQNSSEKNSRDDEIRAHKKAVRKNQNRFEN
jgi:hypothetical protein